MKLSYFVSLTILFLFAFSLSWQWIEKSYVGFISASVSAISPIEVDIEFDGIKIISNARKIVSSDETFDSTSDDTNHDDVPTFPPVCIAGKP